MLSCSLRVAACDNPSGVVCLQEGKTPVIFEAEEGTSEIVALLLDRGPRVGIKDKVQA